MFLKKKNLICVNNENLITIFLDFDSCLVYKIPKWKGNELTVNKRELHNNTYRL